MLTGFANLWFFSYFCVEFCRVYSESYGVITQMSDYLKDKE